MGAAFEIRTMEEKEQEWKERAEEKGPSPETQNLAIAVMVGVGIYILACLACCFRVLYKRYKARQEGFASKAYDEPQDGVTI